MQFLDMAYHRYANPEPILNNVISFGCLAELVETIFREKETEQQWQYYLHKVWDKSFDAFRTEMKADAEARNEFTLETTLEDSMNIANLEFTEG